MSSTEPLNAGIRFEKKHQTEKHRVFILFFTLACRASKLLNALQTEAIARSPYTMNHFKVGHAVEIVVCGMRCSTEKTITATRNRHIYPYLSGQGVE